MSRSLSIAVADDEPIMRDYYREILPLLGHRLACVAQSGREIVEFCRVTRPDLVITDIKMDDMDGIDAAREICAGDPLPVILVSAYHEPDLFERASSEHILAYLVKPIKQADLDAAIAIAMRRFEQFRDIRREAGELRQALEDRKILDKAKGIMMKKASVDESEAYRRLQKLARDNNQKLVDVARMILLAEQAFLPPAT
jgi:AmiR/NasT family two-component response regulator